MAEIITREWAMPNKNTFSIKPIEKFIHRYINLYAGDSAITVDPFARDKKIATYTNDLNPNTQADYHMDAVEFMEMLVNKGIKADCVLFDPPYSPRQITECYSAAGLTATMKDTQNGAFYKRCRDVIRKLCKKDSFVLSFGWNSTGMGKSFHRHEIMLVCHGGAHNDTICLADRMIEEQKDMFDG